MLGKKNEKNPAEKAAEKKQQQPQQRPSEEKLNAEVLEKLVIKKDLEISELTETLQRLQAEFENYKKRIEKEKAAFVAFSNAALLKELLPLLDSFAAAEKRLLEAKECSKQDALGGIVVLQKQFEGVLKKAGVSEIKSIGEKFDPMLHDCLQQGCDEAKPEDIVLEEFQKGYLLNGVPLRHSKVRVNKLPEKKQEDSGEKKEEKKEEKKKAEEKK